MASYRAYLYYLCIGVISFPTIVACALDLGPLWKRSVATHKQLDYERLSMCTIPISEGISDSVFYGGSNSPNWSRDTPNTGADLGIL